MTTTTKKFSVIIPVYNRAQLIRETIESVLTQVFKNYEIIVVDDGSTDGTYTVLEEYGSRIILLSQPNQGPEYARINGIAVAQGEYLVFLDSDDLLLPHTLATYDAVIKHIGHPAVLLGAMIHSSSEYISTLWKQLADRFDAIKLLSYPDFYSKDTSINMSNSKIVINKAIFNAVIASGGTWKKAFPIDDFNLLMRSGTFGPCVIIMKPQTVVYRYHQGNTIGNIDVMCRGIISFIMAEWKGMFPGGMRRCFDRYDRMGGTVFEFLRLAWKHQRYWFACIILLTGWPMILTGSIRCKWPLRKKSVPLVVLQGSDTLKQE